MPRTKITDALVTRSELAEGERDKTIWDSEVTGFGLRLRPGGKTWIVSYRPAGAGRSANSKKLKLASISVIAKVQDARQLARVTLGKIAGGADPLAERREAKRKDKAKIKDLLDRYEADLKRRSYVNRALVMADLRKRLKRHENADIKSVPASDYVGIIERLEREGMDGAAKAFRLRASAFFSWCVSKAHVIDRNPLSSYRKTRATRADRVAKEEHGRALSDGELKAVWNAADPETVFGRLVRFLILTGCRRGEGAGLERPMISDNRRLIVLPAAFVKQGRDHLVPVGETLAELFRACPTDARSELMFPAGKTGGKISGWSKLLPKLRKAAGVGFQLHDLRRTCRTGLSRLGVAADLAEFALGHARGELEATYNRDEAEDRLREAMKLWEDHVLKVTAPKNKREGAFA
jgi:integrase